MGIKKTRNIAFAFVPSILFKICISGSCFKPNCFKTYFGKWPWIVRGTSCGPFSFGIYIQNTLAEIEVHILPGLHIVNVRPCCLTSYEAAASLTQLLWDSNTEKSTIRSVILQKESMKLKRKRSLLQLEQTINPGLDEVDMGQS